MVFGVVEVQIFFESVSASMETYDLFQNYFKYCGIKLVDRCELEIHNFSTENLNDLSKEYQNREIESKNCESHSPRADSIKP